MRSLLRYAVGCNWAELGKWTKLSLKLTGVWVRAQAASWWAERVTPCWRNPIIRSLCRHANVCRYFIYLFIYLVVVDLQNETELQDVCCCLSSSGMCYGAGWGGFERGKTSPVICLLSIPTCFVRIYARLYALYFDVQRLAGELCVWSRETFVCGARCICVFFGIVSIFPMQFLKENIAVKPEGGSNVKERRVIFWTFRENLFKPDRWLIS